ncbi:MAG: glycosyltransferase family 2 protein [Verrucomicrobia bacterium]|nr:glycosyltransferase family 2 protein [Verrucomicrobiota bacterium]
MKPPLSVVIVTYNPRPRVLEWAIDSIERQTLPKDQFELLLVDNNSDPPLDLDELRRGRSCEMRLVREPRQGNVFSRCKGIVEARSDLIVFVDDDNFLAPDYLAESLRIAQVQPSIGTFSGICDAVHERPVPRWRRCILPHVYPYLAVRNYGDRVITSSEDRWGPWEPPTSGMVLRKDVGMRFVDFVEQSPAAQGLGRKGKSSLLACEDSLLARMAYRLGYSCSYQPSLRLYHYIKASRLELRYLYRLMYGLGRSYVLLDRVLGRPLEGSAQTINTASISVALVKRFLGRLLHYQLAGPILWGWDAGFFIELRRQHQRAVRALPPC